MKKPAPKPQEEEWEDPYPQKKFRWSSWISAVLLSLAVYVLSIGPMAMVHSKGLISRPIGPFYGPLLYLAEVFPAFGRGLDSYIIMWL